MTKPFNVRMGDELRSSIDERVDAGEASNASEWAREAMAGVVELGGLETLRAAIQLSGGHPDQSPHPVRALQLQQSTRGLRVSGTEGCTHPEQRHVVTPYSTKCGVCRVTLSQTPQTMQIQKSGPGVGPGR